MDPEMIRCCCRAFELTDNVSALIRPGGIWTVHSVQGCSVPVPVPVKTLAGLSIAGWRDLAVKEGEELTKLRNEFARRERVWKISEDLFSSLRKMLGY